VHSSDDQAGTPAPREGDDEESRELAADRLLEPAEGRRPGVPGARHRNGVLPEEVRASPSVRRCGVRVHTALVSAVAAPR